MKNLNDAPLEDLQKELDRRTKVYKFKIDEVEFELTLEQIKNLQKELDKINPIPSFYRWDEFIKKSNDIPAIPPLKFPPDEYNPFLTYPVPHYPKDKIWCQFNSTNNN
jgi:hypothetical protein